MAIILAVAARFRTPPVTVAKLSVTKLTIAPRKAIGLPELGLDAVPLLAQTSRLRLAMNTAAQVDGFPAASARSRAKPGTTENLLSRRSTAQRAFGPLSQLRDALLPQTAEPSVNRS